MVVGDGDRYGGCVVGGVAGRGRLIYLFAWQFGGEGGR